MWAEYCSPSHSSTSARFFICTQSIDWPTLLNSSQPSAAYGICWQLYLNIPCTTPPNHLCVFDCCKTCSWSSSSCICYIAFVSSRQQLDGSPRIYNIFSGPSCLSCNALAYLPAHNLCTMNALRFWCRGFCRTYSRLFAFCISYTASSSPLGLRFTTNSRQPNRQVALLRISFSLYFLEAQFEYSLSCRRDRSPNLVGYLLCRSTWI